MSYNIIPEYGKEVDKLTNFLNLIQFVNDNLSDEIEKGQLIKFVLRTKSPDKVRNKLITVSEPSTFKELKDTFKKLFKSSKNSLQIISELSTLQQNSNTTLNFATNIEKLVAELKSLHLLENGEENREVICKINDQLGLNSFRNGLNQPTKSTIFAARPKTLIEAIQLALELDTFIFYLES